MKSSDIFSFWPLLTQRQTKNWSLNHSMNSLHFSLTSSHQCLSLSSKPLHLCAIPLFLILNIDGIEASWEGNIFLQILSPGSKISVNLCEVSWSDCYLCSPYTHITYGLAEGQGLCIVWPTGSTYGSMIILYAHMQLSFSFLTDCVVHN